MNFSAKGSKKCLVSWKSTKNHRFGQTLQLLEESTMFWHFDDLLQEKVAKRWKKWLISWKMTKNHRFGENFQLFEQTTMSWHFYELFSKKLQKTPHSLEKHEKSSIWPKLCNFFEQTTMSLHFGQLFEKVAKSASFRETARKIIDLAKALQLLEQATMSFSFWWTFKKKVAKSASSREKAPKIIDFLNLQLSEKTTMFWRFDEHCSKKLQKAARAVKKHEKSSIWPNLCNFSNKLRCFCISMNFQGKSCQKCFPSWKSTKNHRFGQDLQLFEQTTMFWHFDELFRKKMQKVARFVKKHEHSSIWPKLCNFFEQTTMSLHFDQLFGRKLKEVPHFVKKHEKSMIWPKLCNFLNKLQCLFPFDELSRKKLQKVRRLVKKHQKSSIFSNCNFPRKLPCFDVSMNIAANSCKKLLVPWKSTKNHQFGQIFATFRTNFDVFAFRWIFKEKVAKSASFREKARKIIDLAKTLQLFEQTTMFWHFDEVFSKKLQKVPHFVKKHEKSSIWRKLATFPTNYHVLTLWWTFQRKVAESASFSEKTLKIIDWAKTCNFFEQSNMFMRFDELFSKRKQKVPRFVKKHEKSSIWPKLATFRTNYHVLAFRWTFQEKNAKSGPFREKARTLMDLSKTCNFSNKLPCFGISMIIAGKSCKKVEKVAHFVKNDEKSSIWRKVSTFRGNYHVLAFYWTFSARSCKKLLIPWKSTRNHRFGQNFATFRANYHVLAFRWSFQQKVTKSAPFREKARKIVDLAKTRNFSNKLPCFDALVNFSAKSCRKCLVFWENSKNHRLGQDLQLFRTK